MKKLFIAALTSLALVLSLSSNVAVAKSNDNFNPKNPETIVISASETSNSNKYRVYKLKNKKMVATKKKVSINNKKGIRHWKAESKKINNKTWWKIGKNQYFKASRVETVNVARSKKLGIKINNYAN
ncbi:hypothetical protein EGT49_10300 [Companilactobacillus suantsaicola]|uniref:Surface layer protein A domain-containing protein n=2 Tax=Companilactobacillus TaxID=2767879 RepID=A0A4Z0JJ97_9LACO|nr:hypothetical protein [Companilactobacillus suantsaicola]TGD21829.1 hypothetical protein EGT49_10300 [Companilactobacillus suantsaicola]